MKNGEVLEAPVRKIVDLVNANSWQGEQLNAQILNFLGDL
jgi:hypothetical protein